jgi:nucleoside-diphosphate-sugar epimerase
VLVRNFARAPYVARFPVELTHGDISSADDVARAMSGCDVVFHCAYGNEGSDEARAAATVQGTRNVIDAAVRHGISRLVHLSTMAVYGDLREGEIDETRPRRHSGSYYADNKIEAEGLVARASASRGLPAAVLQPTIVYGPLGGNWTAGVLRDLQSGRVILVNGGEGVCNVVYVADVVTALLLAAVREEAVGETFLVSGAVPVTWKEFYQGFERILGNTATLAMTQADAEAHWRRSQTRRSVLRELLDLVRTDEPFRERLLETREGRIAARLLRRVVPKPLRLRLKGVGRQAGRSSAGNREPARPPIHPLPPAKIRLQASRAVVSIDKARRVLGYSPAVDFETGMCLTADWAAWANLLGRRCP